MSYPPCGVEGLARSLTPHLAASKLSVGCTTGRGQGTTKRPRPSREGRPGPQRVSGAVDWAVVAGRHRRDDAEPRRCGRCGAAFPCYYRLAGSNSTADGESAAPTPAEPTRERDEERDLILSANTTPATKARMLLRLEELRRPDEERIEELRRLDKQRRMEMIRVLLGQDS